MDKGGGDRGGVGTEVDTVGGCADKVPKVVGGGSIVAGWGTLLVRGEKGDNGSDVGTGGYRYPVEGSH